MMGYRMTTETQEFPSLGVAAMDASHRMLLTELSALPQAPDAEFARSYPVLIASIERDFHEEEALMEDLGVASFQAHIEQHARMLSALHHTVSRVMQGEIDAGREAVELLPEWLQFHIATMDKALADAVVRRARVHAAN
jgi:hemerythrin-like metal-binding protein